MNQNKAQKGIAVLIALAVIALIMTLTMFFISYVTISKNSARNANDLTTARMLIASAVQRIKAGMSVYAGGTTENFYNVVSKCNISTDLLFTTDTGSDSVGALLSTTNNNIVYYTEDEFNNTAVDFRPQWQYIKDNNGKNHKSCFICYYS